MDVLEIRRLKDQYGWVPNIDQIGSGNSFVNRNWTTIQSAYTDDQTALLDDGGTSSWWYDTRNRIILRRLKEIGMNGCLWDIGGGPGIVSSYLINHGVSCVSIEPSRSGVLAAGQRGVPSIESDLESLALPSASVSCIGLFDVLEHVNDRPRLLREIRRVLAKDGQLIMTVPSLTWLWSQSDLDVGHFLRYSKRSVRAELKNSGFLVRSSRYFFVSIVLPLFVLRSIPFRLGFRQPVDDGVLLNQGGQIVGRILQKFEFGISRFAPLGSSLLVVATPSEPSS